MQKLSILTPLICTLFVLSATGQSDWHTYPVRKIFDLIAEEEKLARSIPTADIGISAKPFPAKTVVTYLGKKRIAGTYARSFIDIWVQTRNVPRENADLLVDEHLFREGGRELWMPVHKAVAGELARTVEPGEEIVIYYFYLGSFNPRSLQEKDTATNKASVVESSETRWMLAVEKFEKVRPAGFAPQSLEKAIDRTMEAPGRILDIWFDPRQVRTKASVVFTGDVRPVSDRRQRLLDLWFEQNGFPSSAVSLMRNEARFLEAGTEYWIAVQNSYLTRLEKTLKRGEPLSLNTILVGGIRTGDKVDWLFVAGGESR
jgi:hypothetical protein